MLCLQDSCIDFRIPRQFESSNEIKVSAREFCTEQTQWGSNGSYKCLDRAFQATGKVVNNLAQVVIRMYREQLQILVTNALCNIHTTITLFSKVALNHMLPNPVRVTIF